MAQPENQAFVRKFRDRFRKDPDAWAAQGYDALHLLARAARSSGSANPLDLAYALRFMSPWEGANGRYHFDGRGEMDDKPIYLNIFRNGAPVTIAGSGAEPAPADPLNRGQALTYVRLFGGGQTDAKVRSGVRVRVSRSRNESLPLL